VSLRDQLGAIYDGHGKLTPQLVVDTARDRSHPLHTRFEWDNTVAGEAWRRHQAGALIRSVGLVYKPATELDGEQSIRAFQAVRREDGHSYEPSETVAADPLLAAMVLRDMEREWQQLRRRYGHFAEFVQMIRADLGETAA
jgi:hypothetical protein